MYYEVARKLVVNNGTYYTQAISMDGANAALSEFTNFGASTGTAVFEEGNDLENWLAVTGGSASFSAGSYGTIKATQIASRYVRIRYVSSGTLILGAGINTSQL